MNPAPDGTWRITPDTNPLRLRLDAPGDVLAGQCALAAAALAGSAVPVWGIVECEPLISLRGVLAQLGASCVPEEEGWLSVIPPEDGLREPPGALHCGAEIDTLLIALGLVCGAGVGAELVWRSQQPDIHSLSQALAVLEAMGARILLRSGPGGCELTVEPARLNCVTLSLPLTPAQLKPMLVFAAQQTPGETRIKEPCALPDHAERALRLLGARISRSPHTLHIEGGAKLDPRPLKVPPDISAVVAPVIACAAQAGSELELPMIGCNPGRTAWLRCLQRSGATVLRERDWQFGTEPVSTLRIGGAEQLKPLLLAPNAAGALLAEAPALAVLASQCRGRSQLRGLAPLHAGTPDILALAAQLLRAFGAQAELLDDGLLLHGPSVLHGAEVNCSGERGLGQLALAAALLAEGPSTLHGMQALERPWPGLQSTLETLTS